MSTWNTKAAIVSTIWLPTENLEEKAPFLTVLLSFLSYHLAIGFDFIYIYIDNPQYEQSSLDSLLPFLFMQKYGSQFSLNLSTQTQYESCELFPKLANCLQTEVHARQQLNAQLAMKDCISQNRKWLLHLDFDELFFIQPSQFDEEEDTLANLRQRVRNHFQSLETRGILQMTYANHEGVPNKLYGHNYFQQVSLFRRHHCTIPLANGVHDCLSFWKNRTTYQQYLIAYDNGKSAVRALPGVIPESVHKWAFAQKDQNIRNRSNFNDPRDLDLSRNSVERSDCNACILHYVNCGFEWLLFKYNQLGNFPDFWFNGKLMIQPCLHTEARDIINTECSNTRLMMLKEFYSNQIAFSKDENEIEYCKQLSSGVTMIITLPSRIITRILENFSPFSLKNDCDHAKIDSKVVKQEQAKQNAAVNTNDYGYEKAWILSSISKEYL